VLPANWSHGNPVDIIGDAPAQRYVDALAALARHPQDSGTLLFIHAPTAIVPASDIARVPAAHPPGRAPAAARRHLDGRRGGGRGAPAVRRRRHRLLRHARAGGGRHRHAARLCPQPSRADRSAPATPAGNANIPRPTPPPCAA
jgi:hypothetical protein